MGSWRGETRLSEAGAVGSGRGSGIDHTDERVKAGEGAEQALGEWRPVGPVKLGDD